jgi:oligosaccharide repeat unit polymerase
MATFEQTLRRNDPLALPAIGIMAVATTIAVALVPPTFSESGALRPSAVAMVLGLVGPILVEVIRRPKALFRADYLLLLGLVYWVLLDLLQGVNEPTGVEIGSVRSAFAAIGLFVVGLWSASLFRPWGLPRIVSRAAEADLKTGVLVGGVCLCFLLGMAHYVLSCDFDLVLLLDSLLKPRFAAPWTMTHLGGWNSFQYHLIYFGYLIPTLTVLIAHRSGWLSMPTAIGLAASACIFIFASQSGTRNELGVILGAALLSWILLQSRISLRVGLTVAAFTVLLLVWFQVMLAVRNDGFQAFFAGDVATERIASDRLAVDDNFHRLCQVMDMMPSRIEHTLGGQIFFVSVRPIPRALWPGKPVGPGFDFSEEIGETWATWSITIVGEFYYDFGYLSVFVGGLFYGRMAGMWNQLLATRKGVVWPVLYGLGAMALFVGLRSQVAIATRIYPILFWLVLDTVFLSRRPAIVPRQALRTGMAGAPT